MINLDTEELGELCIGCAGGRDVNVSFRFQPVEEVRSDDGVQGELKRVKGATRRADTPGASLMRTS